jgi:beta-glucosidase
LLPEVQTRALKALHATGKPVVLVLMSGSAVAIPWEDRHLPAIVQAWYGGQSAGTAAADVLFGDYNPAGRLPVTVYEKDEDLPDFKDYGMEGRTYRYFRGKALYPFGFGLSYTEFRYRRLRLLSAGQSGEALRVRVQVENVGRVAGEEVAQVYLTYPDLPGNAPIRALKGFGRFRLEPGESKELEFSLSPEQLALPDEQGAAFVPSGKVRVSVGGGQPHAGRPTTSNRLLVRGKLR